MKIVIVGPGAMGCLFGAFLSRAGHRVSFLDRKAPRAKEIEKRGIFVEGISGKFSAKKIFAATRAEALGRAELIIISTKSYDTREAIKNAVPLMDEGTLVLTLQNGIGNIELISKFVSKKRIIAGVTAQGATLLADGHTRHAGKGETVIGLVSKSGNQKLKNGLNQIAVIFNEAGLETRITGDVSGLVWSKLIINIGINALTAITGLNNGRLTEFSGTREIMHEAVEEAVRIAKKREIELIYSNLLEKVESVCRATAGNVSSMLQDVLNKRRTEIDFINGAIVNEGKRLGIATPVNSMLVNLVKTIESSYSLRVVPSRQQN